MKKLKIVAIAFTVLVGFLVLVGAVFYLIPFNVFHGVVVGKSGGNIDVVVSDSTRVIKRYPEERGLYRDAQVFIDYDVLNDNDYRDVHIGDYVSVRFPLQSLPETIHGFYPDRVFSVKVDGEKNTGENYIAGMMDTVGDEVIRLIPQGLESAAKQAHLEEIISAFQGEDSCDISYMVYAVDNKTYLLNYMSREYSNAANKNVHRIFLITEEKTSEGWLHSATGYDYAEVIGDGGKYLLLWNEGDREKCKIPFP